MIRSRGNVLRTSTLHVCGEHQRIGDTPRYYEFIRQAAHLLHKNMKQKLSNQDHWDLLIDKFLNGQNRANRDIRTAEIALRQFSQIMLVDEQLDIPKRNLVDINLDDINQIKEVYKNFPKLENKKLKDMCSCWVVFHVFFFLGR